MTAKAAAVELQPAPAPSRDPVTGILAKFAASKPADELSVRQRSWQWARPQVEGQGPCPRGGHSATLVGPTISQRASARIFIFGGHYDRGEREGFAYLNDTFVLDIDENTWSEPRCRGTAPEPRYGHSASLVGSRVVYFGGKGKSQHFRDLHALDAGSLTWYQGPSSGGAPSARHGHTASLHGTRLYVFGGACGAKYFGDLHCLDLSSMAWSSPETTGPKPSARFGHAALLVGESLMIHGGFCMDSADIATRDNSGALLKSCYLNDIRVLDTSRMEWSRLRTHGSPPTGRFGHAVILSEDDAVLFGGWNGAPKDTFGLAVSNSSRAKTEGQSTAGDEETCEYCMTLRTSDMTWVRNRYRGEPASSRYGHSVTAIGPHLIIFGGWDGGKALNDVIVLRDRSVSEQAADDTVFELDGSEQAALAADIAGLADADDEHGELEAFV